MYARVISILTSRNIVTDELDIEEMWKVYQEVIKGTKIEEKFKTKRKRAIGFTGKGFKFDAKEAAKDTEAKLKQKCALGLADSDDEDEFALLTMDKKLDELFSGRASECKIACSG